MEFAFTTDEQAFREDIRQFLRNHPPEHYDRRGHVSGGPHREARHVMALQELPNRRELLPMRHPLYSSMTVTSVVACATTRSARI
jgi:hypothetical protein